MYQTHPCSAGVLLGDELGPAEIYREPPWKSLRVLTELHVFGEDIPPARGEQSQQLNHGTSKLSLLCKSSAQQLPGIVMVSKTDQSHLIMSHFICATSVRKLVKTRLTGYSASQASNQIKWAVAQLLAMIIFTHDTAFNCL